MNRALRMVILIVGIVGALAPITVPQVAAMDGGSIPLCPPSAHFGANTSGKCK
jgi:hypothetical protein